MGLMLYNIGAGMLRAVGDSKRPFIFLVISAILNIVFDLIFVVAFDLGVRGVAYATVIAQTISAVLVLSTMARSESSLKFRIRNLKIDFKILGKIFKVGLPAAIQTSITSFSNVFVQSYINYFGPEFMGGWTSYNTIDAYALLPMEALSGAAMTFVGQNIGKNDAKRAKRGANIAAGISAIMTITICIPIMIFAPHIVQFLNKNGTALEIQYGTTIIHWLTPFLVLRCINLVYGGSLRGAGNSRAYMMITLTSFVVFRRLYLFVVANYISNTHIPIALCYPAGWIVCSTLVLIYYRFVDFSKTRVVDNKK
jgi:putative MATE family efflux protein